MQNGSSARSLGLRCALPVAEPKHLAPCTCARDGHRYTANARAAHPPTHPHLPNFNDSASDVLQLVRSSSLNCYAFEALPTDTLETRASLFTASSKLSDPCTFRIIIKNVTGERLQGERVAACWM